MDLSKIVPQLFDIELQQQKILDWNIPDFKNKITKIKISNPSIPLESPNQYSKFRRQSLVKETYPFKTVQLACTLNQITMGEFGEIGWYVKLLEVEE